MTTQPQGLEFLDVHGPHRMSIPSSPQTCEQQSKEVSVHTGEMWAHHGGGAFSKWEFWVDENEEQPPC